MDTTVNLTKEEAAYLAGVFDGEGSIGLYYCKSHSVPKVQITITNTDFNLRDWLKSKILWVSIHNRKPNNGRLGTKDLWHWKVSNRGQVKAILEVLVPFLIVKLSQTKLILSLLDDEKEELGNRDYNKNPSPELRKRQRDTEVNLKLLKRSQTAIVH